jgi:hypothetical protein
MRAHPLLLCAVLLVPFSRVCPLTDWTGRNLSTRYRKAISCHYAATSCKFGEMTGTMQEDIAREIEGIAKKKGFEGVQFNDIWSVHASLLISSFLFIAAGSHNHTDSVCRWCPVASYSPAVFLYPPFLFPTSRRAKSRLIQGKEGTL